MTYSHAVLSCVVAWSVMSLTGCRSNEDDSSNFDNSLTFGVALGPSGFDLVNEGTTFSLATTNGGTLWFKLESADDMAGRAVRLYTNDGTYGTNDFNNPQSYGHMLLSSLRITDIGAFTVKGYLVEQVGPDIGKETFVASSTVNMQP